jgi:hypothetical protein
MEHAPVVVWIISVKTILVSRQRMITTFISWQSTFNATSKIVVVGCRVVFVSDNLKHTTNIVSRHVATGPD